MIQLPITIKQTTPKQNYFIILMDSVYKELRLDSEHMVYLCVPQGLEPQLGRFGMLGAGIIWRLLYLHVTCLHSDNSNDFLLPYNLRASPCSWPLYITCPGMVASV